LISKRGGRIGRLIYGLFGLAWNLATFLVVPVLAAENVGPIEAIQRSTNLLKRTWGEHIAGNFGIGVIFGLLVLGLILPGLATTTLIASLKSTLPVVLTICLFLLLVILACLLHSTLNKADGAAAAEAS
jgi:hypothetical protein